MKNIGFVDMLFRDIIPKMMETVKAKRVVQKEFEKNKDKIDNLQGAMVFAVDTNPKLFIVYMVILITIFIGLMIGAINLSDPANDIFGYSAFAVLILGCVGAVILGSFYGKKIVVLYTKQQLLLIDEKGDYTKTVELSEIERFNYKKRRLIFEDKNRKIIELHITRLFGLPDFIRFLHKNHDYILELMPPNDKAKYNKFIKNASFRSGFHSEKCAI